MEPELFLYIAGPCVLETADLALRIAERLAEYTRLLPVRFVFKGSFDKANRTSLDAFRGPGMDEGLAILRRVKEELGVPVLSDVHEPAQAAVAAEVLDILQVPAFLCRQTDLVVAAARTGRAVNIKKGQFVAPADMVHAVDKARGAGGGAVTLTERGACFGYNNLVVDFRAFSILRGLGCPVIFDATHSVQIPSAGGASGGERQYIEPLARAAAAYGIDGLFTEVYPDPDLARCDGANSLPLEVVPRLLETVIRVREAAGPPETLPGSPASPLGG